MSAKYRPSSCRLDCRDDHHISQCLAGQSYRKCTLFGQMRLLL